MLNWCTQYLNFHVDYFRTRLSSGQPRANAVTIQVSPNGSSEVTAPPPWNLTAKAAYELINRPLKLVLENDLSDRFFVESTVPLFSQWCSDGWIAPAMGGGSPMAKDITSTGADMVARWRTFYMFDSDRLHPTELSQGWTPPQGDGCQGYQFEVACSLMPIGRWHRLGRRSIENYLPESILSAKNSDTTSALLGSVIGNMAHYYNFKMGLAGDGIYPKDQKKLVRASRSHNFWSSLPQNLHDALENGFGKNIADEFKNIPQNHSWPPAVIAEMSILSDALQDAM